jgi:hypothetical protein
MADHRAPSRFAMLPSSGVTADVIQSTAAHTGSCPSRDIHPRSCELQALRTLDQPAHLDPDRDGLIEIAARTPEPTVAHTRSTGLLLSRQGAQRLQPQRPILPQQLADHACPALVRSDLPFHGKPSHPCTGTREEIGKEGRPVSPQKHLRSSSRICCLTGAPWKFTCPTDCPSETKRRGAFLWGLKEGCNPTTPTFSARPEGPVHLAGSAARPRRRVLLIKYANYHIFVQFVGIVCIVQLWDA